MILLMLRDGSMAEIPQGHDIIHRRQSLICLDRSGEVIVDFNASEVLAYTCSEAAARRFVNDAAEREADEEELEQVDHEDPVSASRQPTARGQRARGHLTGRQGERNAANYA
jgi:hypothetical protein